MHVTSLAGNVKDRPVAVWDHFRVILIFPDWETLFRRIDTCPISGRGPYLPFNGEFQE
jgi:extradiol dioxygenase family protein